MTNFIELQCSCGATKDFPRQLLYDNKNGNVSYHVCGEKYNAGDMIEKERFGIADYTEVKA